MELAQNIGKKITQMLRLLAIEEMASAASD